MAALGSTASDLDTLDRELRALLRRGIVFSILWLMGIGSAVALYSGLKARRIVAASSGQLRGGFTMWWCIVVGTIGVLIWLPVIAVGLYNQFR